MKNKKEKLLPIGTKVKIKKSARKYSAFPDHNCDRKGLYVILNYQTFTDTKEETYLIALRSDIKKDYYLTQNISKCDVYTA